MSDIIWHWTFSVWLISLNVIISRSIHVAANGILSFFVMAVWYSIVYMYHIFFIHSSVDGPLCCFHALVFVNSVAVSLGCIHPLCYGFSRYMPRREIAGLTYTAWSIPRELCREKKIKSKVTYCIIVFTWHFWNSNILEMVNILVIVRD